MSDHARDLPLRDVAEVLRVAFGLTDGRLPAVLPPLSPEDVAAGVDADAWLAWAVGCLPMFAGGLPSLKACRATAAARLAAIAVHRAEGNVSHASPMVRVSRRVLLQLLGDAKLLPWLAECRRVRAEKRRNALEAIRRAKSVSLARP